MRRAVLLLMVAVTLVVAGGAALAATFTCMTYLCTGTEGDDEITGTASAERSTPSKE